jgi:hypothetical protein
MFIIFNTLFFNTLKYFLLFNSGPVQTAENVQSKSLLSFGKAFLLLLYLVRIISCHPHVPWGRESNPSRPQVKAYKVLIIN